MTNNSKNVAEALRAYAACAEEGCYAIDYHILAKDLHKLADALESKEKIQLDTLLERLEIKKENGDYKWA